MEEKLTVGTSKKNALAEKLEEARAEYEKLQKEMTVSSDGKAVRSDKTLSRVLELGNEIERTEAAIKKQNNALEETQMTLDGVKLRYGEVAAEAERRNGTQTGGTGSADTTAAAEQAEAKMESIFAKMKAIASEVGEVFKKAGLGFADIFKNAVSKVGVAVKSLAKNLASMIKNGLKKLITYAGKTAKSFLSLFKGSKQTNGSFTSGIKTMLKYAIGIRSLYALFNKLRTVMTEGFKNLAQYSDATNKSISMVKSALTQLKNSLATAFAPILTVVAPILTKFINMLSTAADYVARLTAALTGQKSYTRAVAVQEDYAASLEDTADAADDAAGSLAGFDEINTIATENASGGAGGGTGASDMFEEVAVEPLSFDSWGEAFSAFLDNLLTNEIPKLKDGLSSLANWINDFAANLYEMFTFEGVKGKVIQLGEDLANALNNFVNENHWDVIGKALGAGLNLALLFLTSFIYTFDWANLGSKLAEMVNNAVAKINWENVGALLWSGFKIAIETLAGFRLNLNMKQLADSASNIVIGFFNSMTETIQSIDWEQLGHQIKEFLVNVDWAGVTESVFTAIGSAFGAAASFLWGFIKDAWKDHPDQGRQDAAG